MPIDNFHTKIRRHKSIFYKFLFAAAFAGIIGLSFAAGYLIKQGQNHVIVASKTQPPTAHEVQEDQLSDDDELPGMVRVSPAKQQIMGIKLGVVKKAAHTHLLKVPGRVSADEKKVYQINAAIEGWITKIYDNTTGSVVKKDELLALFASPNFLTAQQSYLNALTAQERYGLTVRERVQQLSRPERTTKQYKDTLSSLGMTETQIDQITESRDWDEYVQIRAPGPGFILKRNVSEGLRFDKGTPFYTIADITRVWIIADLYENEASYLQPGKTVRVMLPGQNKNLPAKISNILPQFDAASRTLKVRLEASNPGFLLRPDMFVDVELPITTKPAIFIPADAVLDTGLKKTVFVVHGQGSFEPRIVKTGRRLGSFVEIEDGLQEGEHIVLAGNFLLDAESKLELAAAGVNAALEIDPVCGMGVAPKKAHAAKMESQYRGRTYYFCSDQCKQSFDSNPESFLKQAAEPAGKHKGVRTGKHAGVPAPEHSAAGAKAALEIDPVCGMSVTPKEAQAAGLKSLYKGKAYFFCSGSCKQRFDSNPESFLKQAAKPAGGHDIEHAGKHEGVSAGKHTGVTAPEHSLKPAVEKNAGEHTEVHAQEQDGEDK